MYTLYVYDGAKIMKNELKIWKERTKKPPGMGQGAKIIKNELKIWRERAQKPPGTGQDGKITKNEATDWLLSIINGYWL